MSAKVFVVLSTNTKKIINVFFHNYKFKIVSLIIAVLVFSYTEMQSLSEKVVTIPLRVQDQPSNRALANDIPSSINIYLIGKESHLDSIDVNLLSAVISFKGIPIGQHQLIPAITGNIPPEVKIARMIPDRIPAELTAIGSKIVPVVPELVNEPSGEYSVRGTRVIPSSMLIKGPNTIIKDIINLRTEPVYLDDIKNDYTRAVTINKNYSSLIQFERDKTFMVTIFVGSKYIRKNILFHSVVFTNLSSKVEIPPLEYVHVSNITVKVLSVDADIFRPEKDIKFLIDLTEYTKPGLYVLPIQPVHPDFIVIESFFPKELTVELQAPSFKLFR